VLAAAIERAAADAKTVTRQSLREAMAKISVRTPIGPIKFDDHNQAYPHVFIVQIQKGDPRVLREIAPTPPAP
jgi:hypothetical protein